MLENATDLLSRTMAVHITRHYFLIQQNETVSLNDIFCLCQHDITVKKPLKDTLTKIMTNNYEYM